MNKYQEINKTMLQFVFVVKIYLNTYNKFILPNGICLKFAHFKMSYQKFIRHMACLGSCLWGNQGQKVTCPTGKCTCANVLDEWTRVSLNLDKDSFCH